MPGSDLENSIFNALHGYYRAGFWALRSALEFITIRACGSFAYSQQIYATGEAAPRTFRSAWPARGLPLSRRRIALTANCAARGNRCSTRKGGDGGLPAGTQGSVLASSAITLTYGPVSPTPIYGVATGRSMSRRCSGTSGGRGCTPHRYAPWWFSWRAPMPGGRRSRCCSPTGRYRTGGVASGVQRRNGGMNSDIARRSAVSRGESRGKVPLNRLRY